MPNPVSNKPSESDRYKALLAAVQAVDLSGGGFWKPPVGRTTIRLLPPVGNMGDVFFVERGQHYITQNSSFQCIKIDSKGELPCPICETNEGLWQAGNKQAAKPFRVSRSWHMNIIVRGKNPGDEDQGPLVWSAGVKATQQIFSVIQDPEYGDITDVNEGVDLVVTRVGEGSATQYTVTAKRNTSPLGTQEQVDEWLSKARDLTDIELQDYAKLATDSHVDVYLQTGEVPAIEEEEQTPPPPEEPPVEEEAPAPVAPKPQTGKLAVSTAIAARLKARNAAK